MTERHIKLFSLLAGLLCLGTFLSLHLPYDHNKTAINGDGKGYYAYLPALFIYHDLTFSFAEEAEARHYPPGNQHKKQFLNEAEGRTVNKYFSGMALLWLPFFLLAHLFSMVSGLPADGYSKLYQLFTGLSASIYVMFGFWWTVRLIGSFNISASISLISATLILFGTNLFYYTVYDPSLTHAYNYTLLTGALWYFRKSILEQNKKSLTTAAALFGLALAVRPQNVLMAIPALLLLCDIESLFKKIKHLLRPDVLLICTTLVAIPAIFQMILWKKQTGNFIVDSYTGESFDFTNPHFFSMLLSYEKGWFTYTPIMFFALAGLYFLYRYNKVMAAGLLTFLVILVYILSSWWIWTYGHSFGQRVLVDYYAIPGLTLAFLLAGSRREWRTIVLALLFLLTGISLLRAYQHYHGILPSQDISAVDYWGTYFKLVPDAKVETDSLTFIPDYTYFWIDATGTWESFEIVPGTIPHTGVNIHENNLYSPTFHEELPAVMDSVLIVFEASISCREGNCRHAQMVLEFLKEDESLLYSTLQVSPYLFLKKASTLQFGSWSPSGATHVRAYLWNPDSQSVLNINSMRINAAVKDE